jgi:hypothetical protein
LPLALKFGAMSAGAERIVGYGSFGLSSSGSKSYRYNLAALLLSITSRDNIWHGWRHGRCDRNIRLGMHRYLGTLLMGAKTPVERNPSSRSTSRYKILKLPTNCIPPQDLLNPTRIALLTL